MGDDGHIVLMFFIDISCIGISECTRPLSTLLCICRILQMCSFSRLIFFIVSCICYFWIQISEDDCVSLSNGTQPWRWFHRSPTLAYGNTGAFWPKITLKACTTAIFRMKNGTFSLLNLVISTGYVWRIELGYSAVQMLVLKKNTLSIY